MAQTFEEFEKEFLEDIRLNSQIESTTPDDYFFTDTLDRLLKMEYISDYEIVKMQKKCRNGKIMSFDAYTFDRSEKSVVLITNDFEDSCGDVLTRTQLEQHKQRMLNFLQEAYDGKLDQYFDITDSFLSVGKKIGERMNINYVSLTDDQSIDKIKLIIITNKRLSERIKSLPVDSFNNKRVETNIWALKRFYDIYQSGQDREAISINVQKYGVSGIPCIKAEMSGNLDYDAYLAIIPGKLLHEIYYEYGSRLLEGNVRAFLSNRGAVNKGIRLTIQKDPTKFFTYNNGIACTAKAIKLSNDGHSIIGIEDLQIINGGQTTASLTSAVLRDRVLLDNIFVPMKLTVVKNDDYDTMIQNISKYANSQNRVRESDFFSNHPFHRVFEQLAKKIKAPACGGSLHETFWYYERSRGKYEQEQFKLTKKSERENFANKYPKKQVIKKEDLAKFYTSAELLRPDQVSKGNEKCMSFFAEKINDKYKQNPNDFNEQFFKNCICYAILFKSTDMIVKKANWYISETYTKSGVVAYTISKLIYSLPNEYCLDYNLIWRKQELYPSLNAEIEKLARKTFDFVQNLGGNGMEWFKKEDTWNKYKETEYRFSSEFLEELIKKDLIQNKLRSEAKDNKLKNQLISEIEIVKAGKPYRERLIKEGQTRKILSYNEIDLLQLAANSSISGKIPTKKQAQFILKIREKLENEGVIVE